jgi:hypothetical protein
MNAGEAFGACAFSEHANATATSENSRAVAVADGPHRRWPCLRFRINANRPDAFARNAGTTIAFTANAGKAFGTRARPEHSDMRTCAENARAVASADRPHGCRSRLGPSVDADGAHACARNTGPTVANAVNTGETLVAFALPENPVALAYPEHASPIISDLNALNSRNCGVTRVAIQRIHEIALAIRCNGPLPCHVVAMGFVFCRSSVIRAESLGATLVHRPSG